MTALAFDTYKAVKTLREAGADEALAEAVVATVGDAIGGNVATKADLAEVNAALKADIAELKAELKGDIAAVKTEVAIVNTELKGDIAELKGDIAAVKTGIAEVEARLYRHLWVMAAGIVGLTVSLTVALVRLTS